MGRKAAMRQSGQDGARDLAINNIKSIANSLKRCTELLQDKNGMIAYSRDACETERDFKQRAEYF